MDSGVCVTLPKELTPCFFQVLVLSDSRWEPGKTEKESASRLLNCYQPSVTCSCIGRSQKPLLLPRCSNPINKCQVPRGAPRPITETKPIPKCFLRDGWDKDVTKPHGCSQPGRDVALETPACQDADCRIGNRNKLKRRKRRSEKIFVFPMMNVFRSFWGEISNPKSFPLFPHLGMSLA